MEEYKVLIVTGVIFLIFTIAGLARGLIKTVFATFALVAALLIASAVGPQVGKFLTHTMIYESVYDKVQEGISEEIKGKVDLQVSEQMEYINDLPLPESIRKGMAENNNSDIYDVLKVDVFADYVAGYIAALVTNTVAYILTFIAAYILIRLIELFARGLKEIPVIGSLDRLLGMLFGAFNGLMVIWLAFIVITMFCTADWARSILMEVDHTPILKMLYEHNYFFSIIKNITKILF